MSISKANRHADLSRRLMEQANYELDNMGDRVRASERASNAVAQAVKAIAEDRNWRHSSQHLRREISYLLAEEYSVPGIMHLQAIADQLHKNRYEERLSDFLAERLVEDVSGLIESLWEIRETGPNAGYSPSPDQQRIIDRLLISEEEAQANESIDFPPPMPPFNPPTG